MPLREVTRVEEQTQYLGEDGKEGKMRWRWLEKEEADLLKGSRNIRGEEARGRELRREKEGGKKKEGREGI